jgi:Domain of unknown function (DUF4499)
MSAISESPKEGRQGVDLVDLLNAEREEALLLLSWNLFHKKNARKCVMVGVDTKELIVDIYCGNSDTPERRVHTFSDGPLKDHATIITAVGKLFTGYSGASLPDGVSFVVLSIIWLALIAGAATEEDMINYDILGQLQPYVLLLFKKTIYAFYGLIFVMVAHTIEAFYVSYLCNVIGLNTTSNLSWVALTLFMGYPTTSQVMTLAKLAKRKKLRFL